MEHVYTFGHFGDIEDSIFESSVDANLLYAGRHAGHWLPVVGFKTLLDPPQLKPATRRASGGKDLRSLREDPSQNRTLSDTMQYASIGITRQVPS